MQGSLLAIEFSLINTPFRPGKEQFPQGLANIDRWSLTGLT